MKGLVLYGSSTGNTRRVVSRLPEYLQFPVDIFDISTVMDAALLMQYDLLLFFASTWGDGELQADMEAFFVRQQIDLQGKPYAICELGNYYGYDDFEFGALRIMQHQLNLWRGCEFAEPFSMDSLPRKDWDGFTRWCDLLNRSVMGLQ
jgi:flavodoxin